MKKRQSKKNARLPNAYAKSFVASTEVIRAMTDMHRAIAMMGIASLMIGFGMRMYWLKRIPALPPMRALVKFSVSTFCAYCGRKIGGYGILISHGICPECLEEYSGDILKEQPSMMEGDINGN